MSLLILKIFLMVVVALGGLFFNLVGITAFYGYKIYLLFKEEKKKKKKEKKKKEKEKEPPSY